MIVGWTKAVIAAALLAIAAALPAGAQGADSIDLFKVAVPTEEGKTLSRDFGYALGAMVVAASNCGHMDETKHAEVYERVAGFIENVPHHIAGYHISVGWMAGHRDTEQSLDGACDHTVVQATMFMVRRASVNFANWLRENAGHTSDG